MIDTEPEVPVAENSAARREKLAKDRAFRYGTAALLFGLFLGVILWQRTSISSALASGDTVTAEFASSYKLAPHDSTVKESGLSVGEVTSIAYTDHGTVLVKMRVDHAAYKTLGSNPAAHIEPRTILGGRYAVELTPGGGGSFNGSIPLARTTEPVELDRVLEALPKTTRSALQGLVGSLGSTLTASRGQLSSLLAAAPKPMIPAAKAFDALRGETKDTDLQALVTSLSGIGNVLTARDGQLASIAQDLHSTAVVLDNNRAAIAQTVDTLPQTLSATRAGLTGLDGSIRRLQTVATQLEPSVPRLNDLVTRLQPVLDQAQPLMTDLQPLLTDLRPTVQTLVPVVKKATGVLGDLHGPVLDRVNGPVAKFILNPWVGTGAYAGGTDNYMRSAKFYEELAYMATNLDRASMTQDSTGTLLGFQVGASASSLDGLPFDLDSLVQLALEQKGITSPAAQQKLLKQVHLR